MVKKIGKKASRLWFVRLFFLVFAGVIGFRLAYLQIYQAGYWHAVSDGKNSLYEALNPRRGKILVRDYGDPTEYPVATVTQRGFVLADPRLVKDPEQLGKAIAKILNFDGQDEFDSLMLIKNLEAGKRFTEANDMKRAVLVARKVIELPVVIPQDDVPLEEPLVQPEVDVSSMFEQELTDHPNLIARLIARLSKKDDPSEPVARGVSEEQLELIKGLNDPAISYELEDGRAYPEDGFDGHVIGFLGKDDAGTAKGFYGIEGYFQDFLAGQLGSLYSQGFGKKQFTPAIDGGDVVLTIDRTLEVKTCEILQTAVDKYSAKGGSVVIMEPKTGRILAMCGVPTFQPATYNKETDFSVYNNPSIYTAYEPGSIIKPLTMAAALDIGAVKPESTFTDSGTVKVDDITIHNANDKIFGTVSMIEVLEESINTGMVWVERHMGSPALKEYFERFGFGALTGVELKSEASGTVASLNNSAEVYSATAAFGQGVTMTPIQIASAYSALANGGEYMKPHIVDELRYPDGTVDKILPEVVRQVVSEKTATTIGAMMVSVVEYGHGKKAGVAGYYVAGKTGTAQVADDRGKYSETAFNGSFAGYAPVKDPRFVMVVKIEEPKDVLFAEVTAAPVFHDIASFLLKYYGVAPER
ncbi:MAG: penicillin-binding protein 2 [Patescibacteria group bacterium]|jgi:cell division protein FtsI/penicillin-binding protein 2